MKPYLFVFTALLTLTVSCDRNKTESMPELTERVFALASTQTVLMDSLLEAGECPRSFKDGEMITSDIGWWCSGFYPGVIWQVYGYTGDPEILALAQRRTLPLAGLIGRDTDHDIGFQLMSSFGKCYSLTGDEVCPIILKAGAKQLEERFIESAGVIRSWDFGRWNIPVIIDNMMNLELIMEYGDREVAETHAMSTLKNHFRNDWTCFHLVDYADDGSVLGRQTVQGYADESAWARGQAWALYGFTMMARESDKNSGIWLDSAENIARMLLECLPVDGIPYWDFSRDDYKDASAAAIMASAFVELSTLTSDSDLSARCLASAETQLRTLASDEYLTEAGSNGGFLLKHSVGNLPSRSEIDVPLTYTDYYFLEALLRFQEAGRK